MGRLFWKFFFFIWLAQLTTVLGVTGFFTWKDQQRLSRQEGVQLVRAEGPESRPPPTNGMDSGQPPPPHRHHRRGPPTPIAPLICGFLASILFAAILARYFSQPIRTLRSAFDKAAAGDLDVRIGSAMGSRKDELADLGRDFDRMADQLQDMVEGQRRLLHDVSHELRSPLARLQAAIDLARQQPPRQEATMERIEKESVRMDRLVGELLTLSRLEAGTVGRRIEEIEIMELLSGIVADASFEAQALGVAVEVTGNCEGILHGDGELLHRAIENVVRNALKYSPNGEKVLVSVQNCPVSGEAWIAIKDAGPGVPEADLEAIFEPFYRGSEPRVDDGHGLGLAIAKRVIESLGGRISGANRAEGGFCMEINLPVLQPA